MLYLIGPRASGKTSVARVLAKEHGFTCIDLDRAFVDMHASSIADFVKTHGWESFRSEESAILRDTADHFSAQKNMCIATGGGIVLAPENRMCMRSTGIVVYLKASIPVMVERLMRSPKKDQRPALTSQSQVQEVEEIVRVRNPLYTECAHTIIDADGDIDTIARSIAAQYFDRIAQKI